MTSRQANLDVLASMTSLRDAMGERPCPKAWNVRAFFVDWSGRCRGETDCRPVAAALDQLWTNALTPKLKEQARRQAREEIKQQLEPFDAILHWCGRNMGNVVLHQWRGHQLSGFFSLEDFGETLDDLDLADFTDFITGLSDILNTTVADQRVSRQVNELRWQWEREQGPQRLAEAAVSRAAQELLTANKHLAQVPALISDIPGVDQVRLLTLLNEVQALADQAMQLIAKKPTVSADEPDPDEIPQP